MQNVNKRSPFIDKKMPDVRGLQTSLILEYKNVKSFLESRPKVTKQTNGTN